MKSKIKKKYAKKSLGQNFLTDRNYIKKIISSLNPQKNELIIEIGAGRGALTESLIEKSGKVLAIEVDRDLNPLLNEKFGYAENFFLIENDALEINFRDLISLQNDFSKTKLVANLPYYISTAILQHLIQYRHSFSEMVLMLQREVVERITTKPGNKERGFLTVLTEAYFQTEKLFDVPSKAFLPVPKVTSSVMRLITKKDGLIKIKNEKFFRELVSFGFRQKRKTIKNNIKVFNKEMEKRFEMAIDLDKIISELELNPKKRPEDLELEEWIDLSNFYSEF